MSERLELATARLRERIGRQHKYVPDIHDYNTMLDDAEVILAALADLKRRAAVGDAVEAMPVGMSILRQSTEFIYHGINTNRTEAVWNEGATAREALGLPEPDATADATA